MRIAIDAMGGDDAPMVNVLGAIGAAKEAPDLDIVLIGKEDLLNECFDKAGVSGHAIRTVHAPQVVEAHEKPADAFRKKKDSSIAKGAMLLKGGQVDAFVSAGNTGAVVAFSIFTLGRLKGVSRPALASFFPTQTDCTLALDVGATSDVKAINLIQFAFMGSIYFEKIIGKTNPTVGLLSIGEERTKGKDLTHEAFRILEKSPLNFIGNVEGNDILRGKADVVVMDGFVGNAMLKFGESIVHLLADAIRSAVRSQMRYKIGGMLLRPAMKTLFNKLSYEEYGGAVLLGVNGVTIVSHGKSSVKAIKNAILTAQKDARERVNETISEKLKTVGIIEKHG
jgi:glycerol-3-phosphate acyltransferase PlsX